MTAQTPLAIFGAGSFGTALAIQFARSGRDVLLWDHNRERLERMQEHRCNTQYLNDINFPDNLSLEHDFSAMFSGQDYLIAVPSQAFRKLAENMRPHLRAEARIAWATKGFDEASETLLSDVANEVLGEDRSFAVLAGPTFAREVALGKPSAMTIAATDPIFAEGLAGDISCQNFRAYTSDDVIGAQVGGGVKNVLAIAAGVADGLDFGANARVALITRGLSEMTRLGVAMGASSATFTGLAGVGDLILTCTDNQSRNRRFGLAIGQGRSVEDALASIDQVVEGFPTTRLVRKLAQAHNIEMPIVEQTYQVLYHQRSPRAATLALFRRELTAENT